MRDLISIIIPIYNVQAYLPRCIDSLLAQTYNNIEIILVDDGSSDDSGMICDKYATLDSKIKVMHKKNGGVSIARNYGLEIAEGKYVVFVDSDDWVEPMYIADLHSLISVNNVQLGIVEYREVTEKVDGSNFKFKYPELKKMISKSEALNDILNYVMYLGYLWNKIYDRETLNKYNIRFDAKIKIWEDLVFCCQYIIHIDNAIYYNKPLYNYCIRSGSAVTSKSYDKERTIVYAVDILEKLIISEQKLISLNIEIPFYIAVKKLYAQTYINTLIGVEFFNGKYDNFQIENYLLKAKKYLKFVNFRDKIRYYILRFFPNFTYLICKFKQLYLRHKYD